MQKIAASNTAIEHIIVFAAAEQIPANSDPTALQKIITAITGSDVIPTDQINVETNSVEGFLNNPNLLYEFGF